MVRTSRCLWVLVAFPRRLFLMRFDGGSLLCVHCVDLFLAVILSVQDGEGVLQAFFGLLKGSPGLLGGLHIDVLA